MISTGAALKTFITGLNAEAAIDDTLLDVLVDNARVILEAERPWMVLRKTDTSLSLTTASAWNTAIDISGISDFGRYYGEFPIRLYDGANQIQRFHLVPFERRLEYKDVSGTFIYDVNGSQIYINGNVTFSGTLWQNYIADTGAIDLTSASAVWSPFPSRFLPILGYYAVGIYKGGVDYDSINRLMLPTNQGTLEALKNAMENWDNELQLSEQEHVDPVDPYAYPRLGAVDVHNDY